MSTNTYKIRYLDVFLVLFIIAIIVLIYFIISQKNESTKVTITQINETPTSFTPTAIPQVLSPNAPLRLLVKDDDGKSLENVEIVVKTTSSEIQHSLTTNHNGEAFIPNFQFNNDVIVSANHTSCFPYTTSYNEIPSQISIILAKKREIAGEVRSASDALLQQAFVTCQAKKQHNEPSQLLSITGNNGVFKFYPLRKGDYILHATHSDYLPHQKQTHAGNTNVLMLLNKTFLLSVHAVDEHNLPVGGADIEITSQTSGNFRIEKKLTNTQGKAEFDHLPPIAYQVSAMAPYASEPASRLISEPTTDHVFIRFVLKRKSFSLSGKVIDSHTELGLPGANVISQFFHSAASPLIYRATTDLEGFFSFPNLPVGMYKLSVNSYEGYITGDWSQFAKYGVETPTNLTQYIDQDIYNYIIRLSPCWKVKGTVTDPYKNALPDVPIYLRLVYTPSVRGDFMGSRQLDRSTVTDESGTYEIFGDYKIWNKNAYAGVQAKHKWYGQKTHKFIPEPAKTYEIDFSFDQIPNLKGKVFDPNRNPIHQARVIIYTINSIRNSNKISSHGGAYTNEQGEYRIHAKEGNYFLDLRAQGYVMKPEDKSKIIHIQSDQIQTENLVMDYGTKLIGGIVQTSEGEPLEDVSIFIEHYNKKRNITISTDSLDPVSQTDHYGEFSYDLTGLKLRPIMSPKYKLAAVPPKNSGYETAYLDNIHAGDTSIRIILEEKEDKSGTIYGRVISANELPVRQFDLLLKPSLASFFNRDSKDHFQFRWHSYFAGDGTFCLKNIPPDYSPFTIVAMSEDHGLTISNEFSLRPNQVTKDLVVQFTQQTKVSGRVVFQNNSEPLPGAEITFQFLDDPIEQHQVYTRKMVRGLQFWNYSPDQSHVIPFLPHASTDENGSFKVNNLPSKILLMTIRKKRHRTVMHIIDCSKSSQLELGTIPMKLNRRE